MMQLAIYGDSLSTGTHGQGGYLAALEKAFAPCQIHNYAVGSSGCSGHTPNGMTEVLHRTEGQRPPADLILVWHGSNDWYWGTPLGTPEDQSENTFWGAIRTVVGRLREENPEALLVWATPIYRWEAPDGTPQAGAADETPNRAGQRLFMYTDVLRQAADRLHFPLIETGRCSGIYAENANRLLEDRVHPNADGYRKIERVLCSQLQQLWYYHTGEKNVPASR